VKVFIGKEDKRSGDKRMEDKKTERFGNFSNIGFYTFNIALSNIN